jgi:enoyl-CoA hydratase/carnithine racemase
MTEGTPLLNISGSVATLTLRRPSLRNSLTDDDLNSLLAHFDAINRNTAVQVVVLHLGAKTSGVQRWLQRGRV